MDVMVACKKCGKKVPSSGFILDPVFRMMVCRECHRQRVGQSAAKKEEPKEVRPAGWDKEDEYLNKIQKPKPVYNHIDADRIKITCSKCRHSYAYNTVKQFPQHCPQCGTKRS